MCYARPGPRCSSHARADLKDTQATLASAQSLLDAAAALVQSDATPRLHNQHQRDYTRLFDEYVQAKDAFTAARDTYEATPEGIAGLKDDLAARRYELGGTDTDNDPQYQDLLFRLQLGQSQRARQLADYKHAHGDTAPPPDGDVEDEDEAAAPPPPCTCIEYHYEGSCAHLEEHVETVPRNRLPHHTGPRDAPATTSTTASTAPSVHPMALPTHTHGSALASGPLAATAPERPDPGPARRRSLIARLFNG